MSKSKILFLFAILLFISSCKNEQKIQNGIAGTNFNEEVPLQFNFEFQFEQPVVADTLLNVRLDSDLLVFDPPIEGSFYWSQADVLLFSPQHKLNPATNYTVRLGNDPLVKDIASSWSTNFHTPLLSVQDVEGYWGENRNNSNLPGMYLAIRFNHEVSPMELMSNIKVAVDGVDQSFIIEQEEPNRDINLYFPQVVVEDKKLTILVKLNEALKPSRGNLSLVSKLEITKMLTSPFTMKINGADSDHNGTEGTLTVRTTQAVSEEEFKAHFKLEPKIKYRLEMRERQIRIVSEEFDLDKTYKLSITKDMKGVFAGKLEEDFEKDFTFGKLSPTIAFMDQKNIYLGSAGERNVEIKVINVEEVQMQVYKVYENNLIQFFNNRGYYDYYDDYYYDDYYDEYTGDNYQVNQLGDLVYEEVIMSKDLPGKGVNKVLNINFKDKLPAYDGLYQVVLSDKKSYGVRANKIMSISDIGLIVKKGPSTVSVFANSIREATPLSGAEITVRGYNNQVTATATTGADGLAIFSLDDLPSSNFETSLVTAKKGDDYNYMLLSQSEISSSRYDVGGLRENPTGLMTYVYPERDIYRPGEKINFSTIVRDYKWETPKDFPIKIKLTSPSGKEVGTIRKKLNNEGGVDAGFQLTPSSPTGSYYITIMTANDLVMKNHWIKVEEFVPDRIKVNTNIAKDVFENGEDFVVEIEALNLFGTPASNRNWESEMQISRTYFSSPDFSDYNFSINQSNTYFSSVMESGETDVNGYAEAIFTIPEEYANMGMLYARTYTTVFDETGRPVNRTNGGKVHTQDIYYGIKYDGYYHKTNAEITAMIVGVGQDKKASSSGKAEVTLIRHEYKSVLAQSGSYYRYQSVPKEVILEEKIVDLDGKPFAFNFTPDKSGRYEIRVAKPGVANHVSKTYYCYGWGSTDNSSFKVDNEGSIDVKVDKEEYKVGETAKVLMSTPFSGRVLVTVESDKVVKHFYRDTDKKSLAFDLTLTEDMLPNVYVSATLFRPHAVTDLPLTVAHGIAPIIIKDPSRDIPIEITAVEKSRSKTKQTITVKGKPNSKMTLAVVDEGILQITGFKSPDPFDFFYQKRALNVQSYDIYPYLFPEVSLHSGRPGGGDGEADMDKRLNPMTNKRFKLVSFWSGVLETDANGKATYEVDLPQFSGSLRIMAVNYGEKSFGSAEKNMIVADPIVLSAGIPRFLSPGDTLVMPLTITNTTKNNANAKTTFEFEGPLRLVPGSNNNLAIKANAEGRQVVRVAVDEAIGEAKIVAKVNALGETFVHETDISVRPGSPLQKRSGAGAIAGGKSEVLKLDTEGFLEKTVDRKLVLSRSPLVKFTKDIDYLVNYPHGCLEQTISKAFPQLYFEDMIKDMGIYSKNVQSARHNVQQAIIKIQTMQLYNGGFTYWSGRGEANYWGSALATHFLLESDKAGYDVNDETLQLALDFLKMKMKEKTRVKFYYNGDKMRTIIPRSAIYSAYILSLANQPEKSMMNFYKTNGKDLSMDSKYLLAGSFQLIGDEKSFYEVLPKEFKGEEANKTTGGSFSSYLRDEGVVLNVLLECDPENPQINYLARHVSERLTSSRYLNTQERLFGFLAMGKLSRKTAGSTVTADILRGSRTVANFTGKNLTLETDVLKTEDIKVVAKGEGDIYYFWESEGIDAKGNFVEEDKFMRVRKTFYTRGGRPITDNEFKQNDLIVVKISIRGLTGKRIDNVAISDILPAGFEIENPRLDDLPQYSWIKDKSYPDYQDIRDDRINMYLDLYDNNTRNFYYMVRAVSPGKYFMGPIGADAMYNGEYHSYSGAGWIDIKE